MDNKEKEKYKKKKKICEKFGAEKFQELVFITEKIKYKVMKKIMPNFLDFYDKETEKIQKKRIKKAKTKEEIIEINKASNYAKLRTHREYNREQNRNYHINKTDATEIYGYLEWNKNVHKNGLMWNTIFGSVWSIAIILAPEIATPYFIVLLAIEAIKALINFECINLQNYNICRYKLVEDRIVQREIRRVKSEIGDYGEAAKIVHEKITGEEKLPSISEIIDSMETKVQSEQLKNIILREMARRNEEKQKVLSKTNKIYVKHYK